MNPALPADYLARMELDDPEGYRSEVLGEFRAGGSLLFDPEAIRACIVPGRRELSPNSEVPYYQAFVDASGGRRDAFACAIGHRVGDMVVLDALRSWRAPFNPSGVVTVPALCHMASAGCADMPRNGLGIPIVLTWYEESLCLLRALPELLRSERRPGCALGS